MYSVKTVPFVLTSHAFGNRHDARIQVKMQSSPMNKEHPGQPRDVPNIRRTKKQKERNNELLSVLKTRI